jgi:hypothetical protein
MKKLLQLVIVSAALSLGAETVTLDQHVDQTALKRYHHTDQGTRLVPAAWLAAVKKADGGLKFMNKPDLRRLGFLVDNVTAGDRNPFGWPIGFTVSDPKTTGGIPIAGFSCALCHTGQIEYKGTVIRIEGGQAYINMPGFVNGLYDAFAATARDPARRLQFIADAIQAGYPAERMAGDFDKAIASFGNVLLSTGGAKITQIPPGRGRLDAVQGIANQVFSSGLMVSANAKDLDAPVNYPYLWDIWRFSWVQYNGFLPALSTSRNIGEVLGSKATTSLVNPATGELNPEPLRWQTSVQLANIVWMEKMLEGLRAPTWPEKILGPIDRAKAEKGRQLFVAHCAGCHGIKELPKGEWDVTVVPLTAIGTDPNQAANWAGRTYDASKLGLSKTAGAFQLDVAVNKIRKQLYIDNNTPASEQEPDVHFEAPCGYKARPLIGAWATAPFLHNGSVRTVFDLLSDTRATKFRFGSREYDPVKLGYTENESAGSMILDTSISGNRNTGHWFTNDDHKPGKIGPKLSDIEKYAIIEFLKAATYESYPSRKVQQMATMPCQGELGWALANASAK